MAYDFDSEYGDDDDFGELVEPTAKNIMEHAILSNKNGLATNIVHNEYGKCEHKFASVCQMLALSGIRYICDPLTEIVDQQQKLIKRFNGSNYDEKNIYDLLNTINVCQLPKEAPQKGDTIQLTNWKDGQIYDVEIPTQGEGEGIYKYGLYDPNYGVIFIWADNIYDDYSSYRDLTDKIVAKVLLHELIHAALDIDFYTQKWDEVFKWEETLDNMIVLHCFKNDPNIRKFIKDQPSPYNKALAEFGKRRLGSKNSEEAKGIILQEVIKHFHNKIAGKRYFI